MNVSDVTAKPPHSTWLLSYKFTASVPHLSFSPTHPAYTHPKTFRLP